MKSDIELQTEFFRLKSILNKVSDVSYAYSSLKRDYPSSNITKEILPQLIASYENLLDDVISEVKNYEQRTNKITV